MRENNKDSDPGYLKAAYEENVKLYLQYFINKEDFKKLFIFKKEYNAMFKK